MPVSDVARAPPVIEGNYESRTAPEASGGTKVIPPR
jgi:hypothetical protein